MPIGCASRPRRGSTSCPGFSSSAATARMAAEVADVRAGCGKLLVCGNGGSAADAQHAVAVLVGRFPIPGRRGLPATALCACVATLTACSNNIGCEDLPAREVLALGRSTDAILAISKPWLRRTCWRPSTPQRASGCGDWRFWATTAERRAGLATGKSSCLRIRRRASGRCMRTSSTRPAPPVATFDRDGAVVSSAGCNPLHLPAAGAVKGRT